MIEPIVDEQSHRRALRRIEELWDAEPGTPDEQELDALATLVDAYERKQISPPPLDPIAAIQARCEQLGWTLKELEPLIGSPARVLEVIERKRSLTLPMIRRIHEAMQIPADVLIGRPDFKTRPPKKVRRGGSGKGSTEAA